MAVSGHLWIFPMIDEVYRTVGTSVLCELFATPQLLLQMSLVSTAENTPEAELGVLPTVVYKVPSSL